MTPHRLSRVYFFVCIQLWRDGEYHYVSENHYEIKIAEIHLFCPVLPGYFTLFAARTIEQERLRSRATIVVIECVCSV